MKLNLLNQREPGFGSAWCSRPVARWMVTLVGLAMLSLGLAGVRAAEPRFTEYQVKAGFVLSFTKFIEWPTNRFTATNEPFVIGVIEDHPATPVLVQISHGFKIAGRDTVIKVLDKPAAARGVHLLFVPAKEDSRVKEWLAAAHEAGALTVGESDAFFQHSGIINFVPEGEKIRFDVNMDQAVAVGLKVSAQLQKLARTLHRKP